MTIEPTKRAAYAGVYQAYAWQQGYEGTPVEFRIPDQYFTADSGIATREDDGFKIPEFMEVVADMDSEGCIHLWHFRGEVAKDRTIGDRFLTLACTEDDSMTTERFQQMEAEGLKFYHASDEYWEGW